MTTTRVTFDYEKIKERLHADGEMPTSDKEQGLRLGVSERQIRKAKRGELDAYLADIMCTKGLGVHPGVVYPGGWISPESCAEAEADAVAAETRLAKKRKRVSA